MILMKYKNNISAKLLVAVAVLSLSGCTREIDTDVLATYPNLSEVFIDGFSSDLQYQAWGKVTNFDTDTDTKYSGTTSIREVSSILLPAEIFRSMTR